MARTEMTAAYREAEWESYQNNPLIKAYEIRLSGNHTTMKTVKGKRVPVPLTDICDKLAGVYPKTFKWVGWHPQCRCLMIPIMVSKKEFRELLEARKADREAKRAGKEATAVAKINQRAANVPMPKNFTDWLTANHGRIDLARKGGGILPMWITDNVTMPNTITAVTANGSVTTPIAQPQLKPEDIVTQGDPRPQCKQAAEIMRIKTYAELETYVTTNGIASTLKLNTVPFAYAREICATYAQYKHDWNLPTIDLLGTARMGTNMAHAHGKKMEVNPSYFNKVNAPKEVPKLYSECAGDWLANREKTLESRKISLAEWEAEQKKAYENGNTSWYKTCTKYVLDYRRLIAEIEAELNAGHTRHNVLLSETTVLRNVIQHEYGHTVDDRLLGSINSRLKTTQIDDATATTMRTEWARLYYKYKGNCGWLSTYGTTNKQEFLAECMVLYTEKGGVGLPLEVKQWLDKLKSLANATTP